MQTFCICFSYYGLREAINKRKEVNGLNELQVFTDPPSRHSPYEKQVVHMETVWTRWSAFDHASLIFQ